MFSPEHSWVGSREGFSIYDGQMCKTYTPENSELPSLPSYMFVGSTGRVWLGVGYSESMSIFNGNTLINYGAGNIGMPDGNAIDEIASDQQDHI